MSKPRYTHNETVTVSIQVAVGYDRKEGRTDAIQCALRLADGIERGGAGPRGSYNARRIATAVTSDKDPA